MTICVKWAGLQITNDNCFLVTGSHDWVCVWNVDQRTYENLQLQDQMAASESPVTAIAMSSDQKYAACGTRNGAVALWDLEVGSSKSFLSTDITPHL